MLKLFHRSSPSSATQSTPRRIRRRRRFARDDAVNVTFASLSLSLPTSVVEHSPTLMVVAVEDACLRFAIADWAKHRPSRTDSVAMARWLAQRRLFEEKRDRLRSLVEEAIMSS